MTKLNDETQAYIDRIRRVEVDMEEMATSKKEIYIEAKSKGMDIKVLRELVADERKRTKEKNPGEHDKYLELLAFERDRIARLRESFGGTPLGDAALAAHEKGHASY